MKKYYVITGGTSGIGLSIIQELTKDKKNVVFSISRSSDNIEKAKTTLADAADNVFFFQGDASNDNDLNDYLKYVNKATDLINGLVNNAGTLTSGEIEEISINDWNDMLSVNLTAPYLVIKKFLPLLIKAKEASIVNVSSISSMVLGSSICYSICKAGLDMLTKGAAKEFAKHGIRVNSVNPGITNTGFHIKNNLMDEKQYNEFLDKTKKRYPLGIGCPEDIANLVAFLLSNKSKWITGDIIPIDGGRLINS